MHLRVARHGYLQALGNIGSRSNSLCTRDKLLVLLDLPQPDICFYPSVLLGPPKWSRVRGSCYQMEKQVVFIIYPGFRKPNSQIG